MSGILLDEYELLGDARYRSYISAVDKALKNFEYTSEWADLISALGKLNKVRDYILNNFIWLLKKLFNCNICVHKLHNIKHFK